MRNPVKSEADALGVLVLVVVLVGAVAIAGVLGGGWTALAALAGIVLGIAGGIWLRSGPARDQPTWWSPPDPTLASRPAGRLLVLADAALDDPRAIGVIAERTREPDGAVLVVLPAHDLASSRWSPDAEGRLGAAEARRERIAGLLAETAPGRTDAQIGSADASDAAAAALRRFTADAILVLTAPADGPWADAAAIAALADRLALPVERVHLGPP